MNAGKSIKLGIAFCAALAFSAVATAPAAAEDTVVLKVGDAAPDFSLAGTDGKTYTLSEFKGKKSVILAFFPKAFTPG